MHMGGGGGNNFPPPVKKIPASITLGFAPLIPLEMSTSFRIIGLMFGGNGEIGYFLHQKNYVLIC